MFFSVITCTRNSAKYIKRNIDSVKNQDFKDYEHILIDGKSEDGSLRILKRYINTFNNAKLFILEPKGISNAFNQGIRKSKGKYLIFLNSDDYFYDNNVLRDAFDNLKNEKNTDWIYGKINVVEEDGKTIGFFPRHKIFKIANYYLLKYVNFVPHQAVFIKKEVFKKYGFFDETLSSKMDYELWLRVGNKTRWHFLDRKISCFSVRKGAQSSSFEKITENRENLKNVRERYLNKLEYIVANLFSVILNKIYKTVR